MQRRPHIDSNYKKCKQAHLRTWTSTIGDSKPLLCIELISSHRLQPYGWYVPFLGGIHGEGSLEAQHKPQSGQGTTHKSWNTEK